MSTVILLGNVGPAAAPFSTENDYLRSFAALGWNVIAVPEAPGCEAQIREHARAADLVWYVRTHGNGWRSEVACETWEHCRKVGTPTVGAHLDLFVGIGRRDVKVSKDYGLFACDLVATADGNADAAEAFAAAGINHMWLPPAIAHDQVGIGTPRAEYAGDAAWVGSSKGYHREWPRRGELVAALERHYGKSLTRAGDGVTVRGRDLNDLYASVPVVAGDSLALQREDSRYWSDRIPECLGRGGILVHPAMTAGRDEFGGVVQWCGWEVGEQIEMMDRVRSWTPEHRTAHRMLGVREVLRAHTYVHRIQSVLDHLDQS